MRLLAILFVLAVPTPAQFSVAFSPWGAANAKQLVGVDNATIWDVRVCSETNMIRAIPKERIFNAAPSIWAMGSDFGVDTLSRESADSWTSRLWRIGKAVAPYAAAGAAAWVEIPAIAVSGAAPTLIEAGLERAKNKAPNPQPYLATLMPPVVMLQGGGCATYRAVSALMPNPQPVGPILVREDFDFELPGGTQPQINPTAGINGGIATPAYLHVYDSATGQTVTYNLERLRKLRAAYIAAGHTEVFEIPTDYWGIAKGIQQE